MFSIDMMNSIHPNINFKSRNPAVVKADRICRMVNTEFPSVSSSSLIPRCTRTILDKAKRFGEKAPQIENGNQPDDRYNKMYHLFIRTDNKLQELVYGKDGLCQVDLLNKIEITEAAYTSVEKAIYGPYLLDKDVTDFSYVCHE